MSNNRKIGTAPIRIRKDLVERAKKFAHTRHPKSTLQYVLEDALSEYFQRYPLEDTHRPPYLYPIAPCEKPDESLKAAEDTPKLSSDLC